MSRHLPAIAEQCGTDKRPGYHDYAWLYELLLESRRDTPLRLMEIGISKGRSLRMWQEYLPQATIVGIDCEAKREHDSGRVRTFIADQKERRDLAAVLDQVGLAWDVIIDDGGHRMDEQQISLGVLFRAVRPGGLYIIEDVHTSFPHHHPDYGVELGGWNSTYAMLERFARLGQLQSRYLEAAELRYLQDEIAWCTYSFRPTTLHSDLAILRKRSA